jgi:hypothetical protein
MEGAPAAKVGAFSLFFRRAYASFPHHFSHVRNSERRNLISRVLSAAKVATTLSLFSPELTRASMLSASTPQSTFLA